MPLEFTVDGVVVEVPLPSRLLISSAELGAAAARQGLGLVQAPRYRFANDLASGALVEVMQDHPPAPMPISILFPDKRHLSPRVKVFVDWAAEVLSSHLSR